MQSIGRYEIIKDLGQGGMAMVYLARDPAMERQVAIKVLPRQFTFDPQFRTRFHREAKTIAALEHPAIVPVYDYGEHEEQPYIVMRYMSGGSLADRLRESPLGLADITELFKRIAPALDVSHQRGMIDRDLKPGNILYDEWGGAYLSDFGIVKITEGTAAFTGTTIVGTPAYMSPEQASGKGPIDGRSDIYSLAVILYELLTHQLPYKADTPMGLAMAHIIDPIPNILDTNPALPPLSEPIIRRALAKKPDDRYPSAITFANAIAQLTSESSTTPVPTFAGVSHSAAIAMTPPPPARPATGSRPAAQPGTGGVPQSKPSASKRSRFGILFTGVGVALVLGMALTCVGGYVLAALVLTTPTPTATATFTATPTETATATTTSTRTASPTATFAPTDTPELTPGTTRVFIPRTGTPAGGQPVVCNPPEFFDAGLNRCRLPDQNNPGSSGGDNGGSGGGDSGNNPPPAQPTNPPPPPTNPPPPPPTNPPPPPPTNPPPPPPTEPPPPPPTPEPTVWEPPCNPICP